MRVSAPFHVRCAYHVSQPEVLLVSDVPGVYCVDDSRYLPVFIRLILLWYKMEEHARGECYAERGYRDHINELPILVRIGSSFENLLIKLGNIATGYLPFVIAFVSHIGGNREVTVCFHVFQHPGDFLISGRS